MNTRHGTELMLAGVILLCFYAAVLKGVLHKNRNKRAVPILVAVISILFAAGGIALYILMLLSGDMGMTLYSMLIVSAVGLCGYFVMFCLQHSHEINKSALLLFIGYLLVILFITLFIRKGQHNESIRMKLFEDLTDWVRTHDMKYLKHTLQNAALFLPLGILFPMVSGRFEAAVPVVLCAASVSTFIETTQLIFAVGQCDINDIAANTLGALAGYFCFMLFGGRMQ